MRIALLVGVLAVAGCGKKDQESQSESSAPVETEEQPAQDQAQSDRDRIAEDWRKACDAYALSGAADKDPAQRAPSIALWIRDNVQSPEVMKVISNMGSVAPAERKERILAEIRPYGLTECQLTEVVAPSSEGPQ